MHCAGTEPLDQSQRANTRGGWDNRARAQMVLARARCLERHPGLNWYELAKHWGFKGAHAQTAVEQLMQLGFARMERGRDGQPHRFYPA